MEKDNTRTMTFRAPAEIWKFLRQMSLDKEESVNSILLKCVMRLKNNHEKSVDKK